MIQIIAGEKGQGKTKRLLDMANEAGKVADGNIVFIDDDKRHMFDLSYNIRFVETSSFIMDDHRMFYGFIRGILSQDSDIETVRGNGEYIGFSNFNAFYYNGNYEENLFDMEGRYFCDAQLFVFDEEGEIIAEKYFGRDFSEVEE